MLKLLALAFHFSSDRHGAIDPHAGRLLQDLIGGKPLSDEVVALTRQCNTIEPDTAAQPLPGVANHHQRAA